MQALPGFIEKGTSGALHRLFKYHLNIVAFLTYHCICILLKMFRYELVGYQCLSIYTLLGLSLDFLRLFH